MFSHEGEAGAFGTHGFMDTTPQTYLGMTRFKVPHEAYVNEPFTVGVSNGLE